MPTKRRRPAPPKKKGAVSMKQVRKAVRTVASSSRKRGRTSKR